MANVNSTPSQQSNNIDAVDTVNARLTQALGVLYLKFSADEAKGNTADPVLWAVQELLEQAQAAVESVSFAAAA
nr:hypothetical protein [uncultured Rhodoferax sp.]